MGFLFEDIKDFVAIYFKYSHQRYVDVTKDGGSIFCIDANNLYGGYAMSLPLPIGPGVSISRSEFVNERWKRYCTDELGCLLEVDLSFPASKHEWLDDFPPAPEVQYPPSLSGETVNQGTIHAQRGSGKAGQKLLCHFDKRKRYVCYGKTLLFYVQLGARIRQNLEGFMVSFVSLDERVFEKKYC